MNKVFDIPRGAEPSQILAAAFESSAPENSATVIVTGLLVSALVLIIVATVWYGRRRLGQTLQPFLAWLLDKCGDTSEPRRKRDVDRGDVLRIGGLWFGCIVVGLVLVCYVVLRAIPHPMPGQVFAALLWALACLVVGSFVGFLFGVPYVVQNEAPTAPAAPGKTAAVVPVVRYRANTALEQVAEWLTKMVVGVSLVQLTKVPGYLVRASATMSGGYGNNADSTAFGIALIIYFSFVGFLGAYLMTKLYLQAALMRSDTSTLGGAPQQADMTIEEVVALRDGTIGFNKRERVLTGLAAAAATKLLKVDFDQLEDPQDFALWGKAKMSAGGFDDAIKAYAVACDKAPADVTFNLEYATALYLQERRHRSLREDQTPPPPTDDAEKAAQARAAKCIRSRLVETYHRLYPEVNLELRRNVFKSLTYVYLWPDERPDDYERAIDYGLEYQGDPHSAPSSALCVNLARAFGQRAKALKDKWVPINTALADARNQLADTSLADAARAQLIAKQNQLASQKSALDLALEATKQRALKQVRMALRIDPTWAALFRRLLNGREADANDLASFEDDPLFQQVLGLTVIAAPQGLQLKLTDPGTVKASWQAVAGAQSYLPFRQVVPGDPEPVPLPTTTETSVVIGNLPATGTLQFYVQAAYLDGESPYSEIVLLPLTPPASSSTASVQPAPKPDPTNTAPPPDQPDPPPPDDKGTTGK